MGSAHGLVLKVLIFQENPKHPDPTNPLSFCYSDRSDLEISARNTSGFVKETKESEEIEVERENGVHRFYLQLKWEIYLWWVSAEL
jgi:hypothetical protein